MAGALQSRSRFQHGRMERTGREYVAIEQSWCIPECDGAGVLWATWCSHDSTTATIFCNKSTVADLFESNCGPASRRSKAGCHFWYRSRLSHCLLGTAFCGGVCIGCRLEKTDAS